MISHLLSDLLPEPLSIHHLIAAPPLHGRRVADRAVGAEPAGVVGAAAGVGVWLHIAGNDVLHQSGQYPEHVPFQQLQLLAVGKIAGNGAVLFHAVTHPLGRVSRLHRL